MRSSFSIISRSISLSTVSRVKPSVPSVLPAIPHHYHQSVGLFKRSAPKLIHPALVEMLFGTGQFILDLLTDNYMKEKTEIRILNRKVQALFLNLLKLTKNESFLVDLLTPYLSEEELIDANLTNKNWLVKHIPPMITSKIIYKFVSDDERFSGDDDLDKEQLTNTLESLKDGLSTLADVYNSTYEFGIKKGIYEKITIEPVDEAITSRLSALTSMLRPK